MAIMNGPVDERVSRLPGCFNKGFATDIFKEINNGDEYENSINRNADV